jgi:hypothetical protein
MSDYPSVQVVRRESGYRPVSAPPRMVRKESAHSYAFVVAVLVIASTLVAIYDLFLLGSNA